MPVAPSNRRGDAKKSGVAVSRCRERPSGPPEEYHRQRLNPHGWIVVPLDLGAQARQFASHWCEVFPDHLEGERRQQHHHANATEVVGGDEGDVLANTKGN